MWPHRRAGFTASRPPFSLPGSFCTPHPHFKAGTRTSRSFGDLLGGRGPFPFTWAILTNFSPPLSRFDSVLPVIWRAAPGANRQGAEHLAQSAWAQSAMAPIISTDAILPTAALLPGYTTSIYIYISPPLSLSLSLFLFLSPAVAPVFPIGA